MLYGSRGCVSESWLETNIGDSYLLKARRSRPWSSPVLHLRKGLGSRCIPILDAGVDQILVPSDSADAASGAVMMIVACRDYLVCFARRDVARTVFVVVVDVPVSPYIRPLPLGDLVPVDLHPVSPRSR